MGDGESDLIGITLMIFLLYTLSFITVIFLNRCCGIVIN